MADKIVNVKVNADTSTAKQALQDLQRQLDQFSNPNKLTSSTMSSELLKAAQAAEVLKTQLTEATNVNTGRLDLSKFTQQLSQSGMSLEKYQKYFKQFGVEGQKAFSALTTSIAQAEIPLKNMNTMTQKMWTSIKNTINWQISSSLIHGIVGQFSTMVNYAKDLDKSLNNIQIVTGASAQKMTQFAQQANQAAKQLSTTTTAYTNASLIYYQQGLSDKEVKARTDVTIKLANVTKESVTDVSNQLTAIWNNFAEGSSNLEHFADVITALGAATASSSKEIATGLEKFASIADTVGLSYEKATAALATVTAKTRQSADTVGTGFRTIFSRLQSLSLGETLEDGVNLTKYTKALKTIGVQALDTSGNLRSMDNIIMDVGEKWEKLTDSQKMAFANTVGGVRQYATLVALFDDFDEFKANLSIAEASDGTLQNQAEIFADSWEAAGKRVRATAEGIYSRLIKSDDFEGLMDTFSGFLEMIQGIIDGLGGLSGVLVTLGAIATNVFSKQISTGLNNMGLSILTMGGLGEKRLINMQKKAVNMGIEAWGGKDTRDQAMVLSKKNEAADNLAYLTYGSKMNETAAGAMRSMMDYNRRLYMQQAQAGKTAYNARIDYAANARAEAQAAYDKEFAKKAEEKFNSKLLSGISEEQQKAYKIAYTNWKNGTLKDELFKQQYESYVGKPKIDTAIQTASRAEELIQYSHASQLKNILGLSATKGETAQAAAQWRTMRAAIKDEVGTVKDANGNEQINYAKFFEGLGDLSSSAVKAAQALDAMEASAKAAEDKAQTEGSDKPNYDEAREKTQTEEAGEFTQQFDERENKKPTAPKTESEHKVVDTERANIEARGTAALARDNLLRYGEEQSKIITGGEAISKIAGFATSAASAVMMLSNAFEVLSNDTATGAQKLGAVMSIIMGLGTAIPAVINLVQNMGKTVAVVGTEMSLAMWQVTLAAAVIAGLVATFAYLKSQEDTEEKQLKRAKESARELNDVYKDAANRTKDIKSAFDSYDTVYDALQNCIKYSDEWYEALNKVNNQVLNMIQQFPELAGMVGAIEFDKTTGLYTISDDGRKKIEAAYAFQELKARAASMKATQQFTNTQNDIQSNKQETFIKPLTQLLASSGFSSSFVNNNAISSGINLSAYNNDIGEYISTILTNLLFQTSPEKIAEYINKPDESSLIQDLLNSMWNDTLVKQFFQTLYGGDWNINDYDSYTQLAKDLTDELGIYMGLNVDTVSEWLSTIIQQNPNLIASILNTNSQAESLTQANLTQNRLLISQGLQQISPKTTYSQSTIDLLAQTYDEKVDAQIQDIRTKLTEPGNAGGVDNWDSLIKEYSDFTDIITEFIKLNGDKYDILTDANTDVITGNGNQRIINLSLKSNGQQVGVSIDTIAAMVATSRYMESLGEEANVIEPIISTLTSGVDEFYAPMIADQLKQAMFNFLQTGEFGNILSYYAMQELKDWNWWEQLSEDQQKSLLEILGIDNIDEFTEKNQAALNTTENTYKASVKTLSQAMGLNFDDENYQNSDIMLNTAEWFSELSPEAIEQFAVLYNDINKNQKLDPDHEFQTGLNKLLTNENISADTALSVINALTTADWSSLTAIDKIKQDLESLLGSEDFATIFGENGINLNGFLKAMQQVEIAANGINITGFVKAMEGIQSLLSSITLGAKISKKDIDEQYKDIDFSKIGYTDTLGNVIITADQKTARSEIMTQALSIAEGWFNSAQAEAQGEKRSIGDEQHLNKVQSILEYLPYELLDEFLNNHEINGQSLFEIFASPALTQKALINSASMRGYDIAEIQKEAAYRAANASYYRAGEYSDIYEAQAEVIKEKDALAEAEKLRLDTASIQAEAQRLWDHGKGGYESYTDTLQAVIDKETKLFDFRKQLTQEATDWDINYDNVIEYAKQLREIGEFKENEIGASERYALALLKQDAAIDTIKSNYAEWLKILNDTEAAPLDQKQAFNDLQNALKQLFNFAKKEDTISDQLMNWAKQTGNLKKLIDGDKKAWGEALAEQAKGLINNDKLTEQLTEDINEFTASMAQKKKGEIITQEDVERAKELVKQAGDLTNEQKSNLFKSLTNAEGDFGFNDNGELVRHVRLDVDPDSVADSQAQLQSVIDSIPEGETIDLHLKQNDEIQTVPLNSDSTINADGTITYIGPDGETHTANISGGYDISGDINNPVVVSKGTGSSSKGGGGGGGKKEPHKPKRYRNITNQIQNNDRKTQSISRKKDRAAGTEKLDLLKQERDLREANLKLQQQYQSEIEDWLDKDKDKMMEAFVAINFTPIFDEAGEVINNDEFEKAFEAIGDGSNEAWKKAEEALAQYEETLDLLNDKLNEIEELQEQIFDSLLEDTKTRIELNLDVSIDRFEYLDYLLDKIDNDAYQAAEAIALVGEKTAETMKKVNTYTTGLEEILSRHGFSLADLNNLTVSDLENAGFTQAEIDQIKEWRSELLTANKDLLEMRKTIVERVISALNDLNEKVQKSYDKFDAYNSVLEKYKNITDLMSRNISAQSRQIMNQLNNTMLRNAQNTAAAARRIYEDAEMEMAQAQVAYELAVASGDQEAIRRWQEVIDATSEHLQQAEEQWLESWNSALEQAKTMFEDMMEQIQKDYSATMGSTFGSLDYLQAAYDRQKELGEMYERDFDRLYDLSKLSRDISKVIDDNESIQGKQRLRKLQAEINKLQADGTKLSEYDVEVLRKKFELEQARLALSEAQNAKSQVRLQRDSEGNWGYVYTADEDQIAEAEQAYEDKLHEYQVLNDDYINQLQDKALEVQQTWSEVVGEIYSDLGLGVITDEEAAARLEEANRWLNEQRAYFEEQSNHALENQASLYDRTLNTYHVASAEIVDTWEETNIALLTKINDLQNYMSKWNEASETFLNHSSEVIDKYKEDIDKINEMAGISTTKFENHIDNVVVNINDMSDDTMSSVYDLSGTVKTEFSSALSEAVNWELQYIDAMDAMINRNETFVKSLNLMIEKLAGVNTSITEMLTPLETLDNIINQSTTPVYYQNNLSELTGTSAQRILALLNANIAAYSTGLGDLGISSINGVSNNIDQNVTITAEFPNATNHSEIEEAFTNLINKASQYANRKGI